MYIVLDDGVYAKRKLTHINSNGWAFYLSGFSKTAAPRNSHTHTQRTITRTHTTQHTIRRIINKLINVAQDMGRAVI